MNINKINSKSVAMTMVGNLPTGCDIAALAVGVMVGYLMAEGVE